MEDRTLLSAGDLDPTFGLGGKVTTGFQGALDSQTKAAALQPDGKIVVAGDVNNGFGTEPALARYDADGNLDPAFGDGGLVISVSASARLNDLTTVVVQRDGKIIVGGRLVGHQDFVLARHNGNGSLDSSFGDSGVVTTHFSNDAYLGGITLQSDGKIIAAGSTAGGTNSALVVVRYNVDGSLDATFGTDGIVQSVPVGANAVTVQSDGKIIVAGATGHIGEVPSAFLVARYNPDGSLDASFGAGGIVTSQFQAGPMLDAFATAVVLQPDGRIVVGGTSYIVSAGARNYYSVARYNSDGNLDSTFGMGGEVIAQFQAILTGLALQTDGKIVAAGMETDFGGDLLGLTVARFSPTGTLDPTFGSQGTVTTSMYDLETENVLVQTSGRIVVAGSIASDASNSNTHQIILNAFTSTGSPDQTFGTAGQVTTVFTGTVAALVASVLMQPDGRIVTVGISHGALALTRYTQDGNLDSTFGNGGRVTTAVGGVTDLPFIRVVLQTDGKILFGFFVAGRGVLLVRYNSDGSLDPEFGSGGIVTGNGSSTFPERVTLQPDGKILMAGLSGADAVLARLQTDGSPDTGFSADLSNVFPGAVRGIRGLALQADGKILLSVSGLSSNGRDKYVLVRLNPAGSLDPTFGVGGIATTDFSGELRVQRDGRVLMIAANVRPVPSSPVALARFYANGNPDTTFGTGGKVLASVGDDFVIQPDGKILLAGRTAAGLFGLARLDPNGALDSTFGTGGSATADLASGTNPGPVSMVLQPDGRTVAAGTADVGQTPAFGVARFLTDNPITDPNQRFVTHLYLDLLERSPDTGGLTSFTTALTQGQLTRLQVAQILINSPEYHTLEVQGLYGRLLGRMADPIGLSNWVAFLNQGGTAEQLEAIFIGSAEYFSQRGGGAASGFLQTVYSDVLRRPIDPSGAQSWGQALTNGASPASVATAILASPEADQVEVEDLYLQVLHRLPDPSGSSSYSNALQQGLPNELLLAILAASDEYLGRP